MLTSIGARLQLYLSRLGSVRPGLIAALCMGIAAAALLHKSLLPGYTLVPLDIIQNVAPWDGLDVGRRANRLLIDPFFTFYPNRYLLTEMIRARQLPLWNPYVLTGAPTFADPNFQPFYPPNLLAALFLPVHHALPWLAWFHLTLTGSLMYLFLRQHRLRWVACTLGGMIWMLNGYTLVWLENPHRLSTAAWIPAVFWAYEAATQRRSVALAAVGGLFLGLAILGGQVQFVFMICLALGLYGITKLILMYAKPSWFENGCLSPREASTRLDVRDTARPLIYLGVIAVIGLGIGTLILLPASEFSALSHRNQTTISNILDTRWPARHLITLVAPDFFGNPATESRYWGDFNYAELTAYFGVVALLLALTAPMVARHGPFLVVSLVLAVATLAVALGTPLARLLPLLPGSQFMVLRRTIFLIPLTGSWLAALGLDGWLNPGVSRSRRLLALGLALALMAVVIIWVITGLGETFDDHRVESLADLLRGVALVMAAGLLLLLSRRWALVTGAFILLLASVELWQWGRDFNPIISTEYLYPDNQVVQFLRQDPDLYRVLPLQSGKIVLGPNLLSLFGIQDVIGYSSLIKEDYYQLVESMDDWIEIPWMDGNDNMLIMSHYHPLVSLLNVKYVLSANELQPTKVVQIDHLGCDRSVPISENTTVQGFDVAEPGLSEVQIQFDEIDGAPGEQVHFTLWRDNPAFEILAEVSVPSEEIESEPLYTFAFPPQRDLAGQRLYWRLTSESDASVCQDADGGYSFATFATWLENKGTFDGVWIYENPNVAPRAYVVHSVQIAPKESALNALHSPDFSWYESAILGDNLPPEQQSQLSKVPIPSESQVLVRDYGPNQVEIQVDGPAPGLLVLSDAFYPGWKATVDGHPVPIHEVNHTMRGVYVPAGQHTVEFRLEPVILRVAAVISLSSLVLAITILLASWWKSRRSYNAQGEDSGLRAPRDE